VEADVYVWRFALLVVHSRKEEVATEDGYFVFRIHPRKGNLPQRWGVRNCWLAVIFYGFKFRSDAS